MTNKVKTVLFCAGLAVSGALTSCDTHTEQNQKEPEQPKKEFKTTPTQKTQNQIVREYYNRVYDSIKVRNGAKSLADQWDLMPNHYGNQDKINELKHPYSLGGVMEEEVYSAGSKIIENAYKQIVTELAKYHVSLDIVQDSDVFNFKRTSTGYDNRLYETDETVLKYDMCFVGLGDTISEDSEYYSWEADDAWNRLLKAIYTNIDAANYGQSQKDNMKTTVNKIAEKAKKDLVLSKKSVEAKYAPYYMVSEYYLGICNEGEGCYSYGYRDIDFANSKYKITKNYVSVYDSKLKTEFFGDPDAKYELVSHGNGKWQVIKTSKDGTVSKTHVFEDQKDLSEYAYFSDEPQKIGENMFGFTPGYNYGVHVSSETVINVQKRQKDWVVKLPNNVQHIVDSLEQDDKAIEDFKNEMYKKFDEADSIADAMTKKKFGRSW